MKNNTLIDLLRIKCKRIDNQDTHCKFTDDLNRLKLYRLSTSNLFSD